MKKQIEYNEGQKLGKCIYLKDDHPRINRDGTKERRALFLCECGKQFVADITSVKTGNTKSCGCYRRRLNKERQFKHGMSQHPMYNIWNAIICRCNHPNDSRYKYYGGRGITVYDEWENDPKAFIEYVVRLPKYGTPGYSIDRINNDGNYEPGNLRWATYIEQSANQRLLRKNNSTGHYFVGPVKRSNQFRVRIKGRYIGTYNTINEAVEARNEYIIKNDLKQYPIQKIK